MADSSPGKAVQAGSIYFMDFLPRELCSPFLRQILLSYLAMVLAGILDPLLGAGCLMLFGLIHLTGMYRFFRVASTGILFLFCALYLLKPSMLFLVLFTFYFQAVYYWGAAKPNHLLWLTVVGFVHLAVMSTVMSSVVFPLVFLIYVMVLVQSLLVTNFITGLLDDQSRVQVGELNRCESHFIRKMRGIGYWIGGISIVIAMILFPVLPRTGRLAYQPSQFTQESLSGFSDEVSIGDTSEIIQDGRVALRVFIPKSLSGRVWRWRGAALEEWDNMRQRWVTSSPREERFPISGEGISLYPPLSQRPNLRNETIRVNVTSMSRPMIFFPEIDGKPPWVVARVSGDFDFLRFDPWSWTAMIPEDYSYRGFEYRLGILEDREIEKLGYPPIPLSLKRRCTNLSTLPENLLKVLAERGEELVPGFLEKKHPPLAVARKLMMGLQMSQTYTLDYTNEGMAPNLYEFIKEKKAGHCEYFATTLTLLLRMYDIPARVVTGFQTGRASFFGEYQIIRQSDAHAWVEAYFEDVGWMAFDPTPSNQGLLNPVNQTMGYMLDIYDLMQLYWNVYVLDYTQKDQRGFYAELFSKGFRVLEILSLTGYSFYLIRKLIAGILFVVFLIWLLGEIVPGFGGRFQFLSLRLPFLRWFRWKRAESHLASRIFQRIEKEWTHKGFTRKPGETPQVYLNRLAVSDPRTAELCEKFLKVYHPARFGRPDTGEGDGQELTTLCTEFIRLARS